MVVMDGNTLCFLFTLYTAEMYTVLERVFLFRLFFFF